MLVKNITLITRISNPNKTGTYWAAQCDCGNYFPVYVVKSLADRPQYRDRHLANLLLLAPCKWECRCFCGRTTIVQAGNLFSGHTRSCGHLETEKLLPSKMIDISGQKFGELTPIEPILLENVSPGIVYVVVVKNMMLLRQILLLVM